MKFLTKEDLLNREVKVSKVVFENDEFVYVKEMSGRDRSILEMSMIKFKEGENLASVTSEKDITMDTTNLKSKYACMCLCDEKGNLLFTIDDADKFGSAISSTELDLIVDEADKLNAFMNKGKEDLVKN